MTTAPPQPYARPDGRTLSSSTGNSETKVNWRRILFDALRKRTQGKAGG